MDEYLLYLFLKYAKNNFWWNLLVELVPCGLSVSKRVIQLVAWDVDFGSFYSRGGAYYSRKSRVEYVLRRQEDKGGVFLSDDSNRLTIHGPGICRLS